MTENVEEVSCRQTNLFKKMEFENMRLSQGMKVIENDISQFVSFVTNAMYILF